ncbi:ABC transporter ATP-binding protein [Paenibacillus eucommiae]|uniref:ABC transport system ATP-binding protein n=1 Tax=Paenibacillus eucommiae TaxID=1355755 RepID=A0ABS4J8B7_9BACL|nr:ABC transporter ATP-binding protein [Paenibacillus eucommiae]MBP1996096.1 putative ABC transport system ATP-binding protein [Paenibacillus eucommiae]
MAILNAAKLKRQKGVTEPAAVYGENGEPLLSVRNVRKSFVSGNQNVEVLKGIEMSIDSGRLTMLRGRSGSGKTTLLNLLGGLDRPTEGGVYFRSRPLHEWSDKQLTIVRRREIGFIFQSFALLPLLTAWENVELALRMAGTPRSEWRARVGSCLELVGLTKRAFHRPFELSGGEQQRVAIAKAIAHKPPLLLADEPTAELDSQMAASIIAVFRDIVEVERMAICMTTHDSTLWEAADVVYQMVDGRIVPE